jgi:ankyrin repeat protein
MASAARKESDHVVRLLLEKGVDPNAIGQRSAPALYNATDAGNLEIVQLLLRKGAPVNASGRQCVDGSGEPR